VCEAKSGLGGIFSSLKRRVANKETDG